MVLGVNILATGSVNEVSIPAKTTDVLEWIRKKYKNPEFQFQGKIQNPTDETQWLSIFACPNEDDENVNTHMLPAPFDEEVYSGNIIILCTKSEQQDNYDPNISQYIQKSVTQLHNRYKTRHSFSKLYKHGHMYKKYTNSTKLLKQRNIQNSTQLFF
jgi:hypothetical protein